MLRCARVISAVALAVLVPMTVSGEPTLDLPDPVNSEVRLQIGPSNWIDEPVMLTVVPDNLPAPQPGFEIQVTVKRTSGNPWPGASVLVVFPAVSVQALCWCAEQSSQWADHSGGRRFFWAIADAAGVARIRVGAGGCVQGPQACKIKAAASGVVDPDAGITLRDYGAVNSPDLIGAGGIACDRIVDVRDLVSYAVVHLGVAPYTICADFTGNGAVDAGDLQIYAIHHVRAASCTQAR